MMTMTDYEYVRALWDRFCDMSDISERDEWEAAHERLHKVLGRQKRRLLLALSDAHGITVEAASLAGFVAGLRLGLGMATELGQYSYIADIEQRVVMRMDKDPEDRRP